MQTDQGAVDAAKVNLAYCHIVSPIDGRVGLRLVDQGLRRDLRHHRIRRHRPGPAHVGDFRGCREDDLPEISQRLPAGATLPVEAWDGQTPNCSRTGTVGALDSQISTTTGTLNLRAMFGTRTRCSTQPVRQCAFAGQHDTGCRSIPVPAVQHGGPGTFVYLVNADDTVSVRPIKVGPTDGNFEPVLSGLNPGDRVVTDGTDRLRDGAGGGAPSAGAQKGGPPGPVHHPLRGAPPGQGVPSAQGAPPG